MPLSKISFRVYWWKNCKNWSIFSENTEKIL